MLDVGSLFNPAPVAPPPVAPMPAPPPPAVKHFSRNVAARAQGVFNQEKASRQPMGRPMDKSPVESGWGSGK